jgi:hypothetical protein
MVGLPVQAQDQVCQSTEQSTETVLPGVTLVWDSAFLCADAAPSGQYQITVSVSHTGSGEAVEIQSAPLMLTSPRPFGQQPPATGTATGLPFTLAPGGSQTFDVSGQYELVQTDEGLKINLHFRAAGQALSSGEPFQLGINVALRGSGAVDNGGGDDDGAPPTGGDDGEGPPAWVPGPPPWAGPPDVSSEGSGGPPAFAGQSGRRS